MTQNKEQKTEEDEAAHKTVEWIDGAEAATINKAAIKLSQALKKETRLLCSLEVRLKRLRA
jgi:hypothetical protein